MQTQYRIFDWYIKNPTSYTRKSYKGVDCGVLSIPVITYNEWKNSEIAEDLNGDGIINSDDFQSITNNTPQDTYIYNIINVFNNTIGNTFSSQLAIVSNIDSEMCIEDGKYKFSILIGNGGVTVEDTTINLDTTEFHNYWLCLKNDDARLYIDNALVWKGTPSVTSTNIQNSIGFMKYEGTSEGDEADLYIKILRCTSGSKHPIDFNNLKFEVQVDTTDSFDSVNLRTYYNVGSDVFCREDSSIKSIHYGDKLARAFRIPLIPRQPDMPYFFFYRVRILGGDLGNSNWAYSMYEKPDNPFLYDTKYSLSLINGAKENLVVYCIENNSSYIFIKGSLEEYDNENTIVCELSDGYWKKVINSYFMLDPDLTDTIWDHMLNDRLPGSNVYSKYEKSGNVSLSIESDAIMVDTLRTKILKSLRNSSINSASDNVLDTIFGKRYGLKKENFGNILEYRYALLAIQNALCKSGEIGSAIELFNNIFGVEPSINEYKELSGWVIVNDKDLLQTPYNDRYYLFDGGTLYPDFNEAVLYSDNELAFGFDISIYNPFDVYLSEDAVKSIIRMFKPAVSYANIIMHDSDGREFQYKANYYFSNYGYGLYYPINLNEQ